MSESNNDKAIMAVKSYLTPILLTIIGTFTLSYLAELKSDVKTLLINQSANQVKIEMLQTNTTALQKDVDYLKTNQIYNSQNHDFSYGFKQPAKKEDDEYKIQKR